MTIACSGGRINLKDFDVGYFIRTKKFSPTLFAEFYSSFIRNKSITLIYHAKDTSRLCVDDSPAIFYFDVPNFSIRIGMGYIYSSQFNREHESV